MTKVNKPMVVEGTEPNPRRRSTRGDTAAAVPPKRLADRLARRANAEDNLHRWRYFLSWPFWGVVLVILCGTLGFKATSWLLQSSGPNSCVSVYWPMASGSMRLYCAQIEAETRTVSGLLEAIALVDDLPADHPIRGEVDRYIEAWSLEILNLAEEQFQEGELDTAIQIVAQIPPNSNAAQMASDRQIQWQEIWRKGETLYGNITALLQKSEWTQAFQEAVKLTFLDSRYWSTLKYNAVIDQIEVARTESSKLDQAYEKLRQGGIDNLLQVINLAKAITPESYAYEEAQSLMGDAKNGILKLAQQHIKNQNWGSLETMAKKIPTSLAMDREVKEWLIFANGGKKATQGTVGQLEAAMVELQMVPSDSAFYDDAQYLIGAWGREIDDVIFLDQARTIAQGGSLTNLSEAIAKARLIEASNPKFNDAKEEISGWQRRIETMEDQPIIDQANRLAAPGTLESLRAAIAHISLVPPNRALSAQAQSKKVAWQNTIERREDQPILNQAIALANNNNYRAAISTAERITTGRVLHSEAQSKIRTWKQELTASELLRQAYGLASGEEPQNLASAISTAQKIPSGTQVKESSQEIINRWSYQILAIAQDRAGFSISEAIQVAKLVPSNTAAYRPAQNQITAWNQALNPSITRDNVNFYEGNW